MTSNSEATEEKPRSLGSTLVLVGVAIGTLVLMRLLPPEMKFQVLGGGFAGLLVGLIPYFVAKSRNRKQFGTGSALACALGGMAGGILAAAPLCAVLTIVLLVQPRGEETGSDDEDSDDADY